MNYEVVVALIHHLAKLQIEIPGYRKPLVSKET